MILLPTHGLTKAPLPNARTQASGIAVNNFLYVIGGGNGNNGTAYSTNYRYDDATDIWTTQAPMLTARRHAAIAANSQMIYVIGGLNSSDNFVTTNEAYDIASNTWAAKASMPTPRFGAAAAIVNGQIYVIGGTQGISGTNTNTGLTTNEVYDPMLNRWQSSPAMPTARYQHSLAVVNNSIYVMAATMVELPSQRTRFTRRGGCTTFTKRTKGL